MAELRRCSFLLAAALTTILCSHVAAQSYPAKPLRLIVPYAPGGGVDIVARAVAQELSKRIAQSVIVENRTGAGGNIGSEVVARSTPDGYTLLMASPANTINPSLYTKMPYEPARDLAPIALRCRDLSQSRNCRSTRYTRDERAAANDERAAHRRHAGAIRRVFC